MTKVEQRRALKAAELAARAAGRIIKSNLRAAKTVNEATSHDIKLQLDVQCQELIDRTLQKLFPEIALLGEEGVSGETEATYRWVVDPIDGTVNYAYGIPHAAVSIALQERRVGQRPAASGSDLYSTILGLIYDPFLDELWTATEHEPARLNGDPIRVSRRKTLKVAMVAMGFGKNLFTLKGSVETFVRLSGAAKKVRNMGSAALALAYVSCGRFDAYLERGISLWDIAAGGFIVERAGGQFWRECLGDPLKFRMITSNGLLHRSLVPIFKAR